MSFECDEQSSGDITVLLAALTGGLPDSSFVPSVVTLEPWAECSIPLPSLYR